MARTTVVKSARKAQGSCRRCGTEINVGDSYKWFANRIGRYSQRKVFCATCRIRPSDQTTSDKLARLYMAVEGVEDSMAAATCAADYAQALNDAADEVREVGGEYGESADSIVDGFGHDTYQSDEIREKAEACEEFASTLEEAASEIEGMEDFGDDEAIRDEVGDDDEAHAEKRDEWREAIESRADEALGECPL